MRRLFDWSTQAGQSASRHSNQQHQHQQQQQQPQQQSFEQQQTNRPNQSQPQNPSQICSQQSGPHPQAHPPATSSINRPINQSISPRELEIQNLTKLFHEIKYYQASSSPLPSSASSQSHRDFIEKVHQTLPSFLNVFASDQIINTNNNSSPHQQLQQSYMRYSTYSNVGSMDRELEATHSRSSSPVSLSRSPVSPVPPRFPPMDRFPDLSPFAYTISRLFVSEVRRKASNKHAEHASLAILRYLSPHVSKFLDDLDVATQGDEQSKSDTSPRAKTHTSDESTHGWNLLLCLNTLVTSQNSQIIQLLCDASVPSTLIKCLYLFFDLQPLSNIKESQSKANTPSEKESQSHGANKSSDAISGFSTQTLNDDHSFVIPLLKAFSQLLTQLCSHQEAINELIIKDDLRLLFGLASSQCRAQNTPWRETAFQALITIAKNMSDNFTYLAENSCIQNYVENIYRVNSLSLVNMSEFIEMIGALIEFLYNLDVNNRNQPKSLAPIIEQFLSSRFIDIVEELLLKIDDSINELNAVDNENQKSDNQPVSYQPSVSSEQGDRVDELRRYARRLVQFFTMMAKINTNQETMLEKVTLRPIAANRYEMFEQFRMPRPSARNCILNYETLRLMKTAWSRCRDHHLIEAILDATISLFNDDKYNYFILESQQVLVYYMTSDNFMSFPLRIKHKLFKFIEFVTIETNYITCLELGTLGTLMKQSSDSNPDLILILRTLIACLRFNSKFNDIFRDIGLLEIISNTLMRTMQKQQKSDNSTRNDHLEILYLSFEASQCLLSGPNAINCTQFNESGAARHVFACLSNPRFFHLLVPQQGSSSDDSVDVNQANLFVIQRANTPPLSALVRSSLQTPVHYKSFDRRGAKQIQKVAFSIIRQLILSSGDEHLANLLGLLARNIEDLKKTDVSADELVAESNDQREGSHVQPARSVDNNLVFLVSQEINLKICILKSLMIILRESHRCRTFFRKTSGFSYIVSALETVSKSLPLADIPSDDDDGPNEEDEREIWKSINNRRIWRLIKNCLMTIVVAMRSEPSNIRAFNDEALPKFVEAIRHLGCFKVNQLNLSPQHEIIKSGFDHDFSRYRPIFLAPPTRDFSTLPNENIKPTEACCQLFRFLYDMSLDMGDGTSDLEAELENSYKTHSKIINHERRSVSPQSHYISESKSISFDRSNDYPTSDMFKRRTQLSAAPKRPPSLDLNASKLATPALLTFPSVIMAILDLLPSSPDADLIIFITSVIKSLFKHERNQQLLCEAGMVSKLFSTNLIVCITEKSHILHETFSFFLERLTRQSITAKELATLLRINEPLRCQNLDDITIQECDSQKSSDEPQSELHQVSNNTSESTEKVSTHLIESLVSMLDDKLVSYSGLRQRQPVCPFIEFDLSSENHLTLIFMPSIAPINVKSLQTQSSSFLNSTLDVHTYEKNGILGGVGNQERQFPPQSGFTFSTWVQIDKFPIRSSDSNHNLRLLTIYRGSASTGKEYCCFKMQISALDRAIILSTQESLLFESENRPNDGPLADPDHDLRVWTPELLLEGKWHHIAVTLSRSTSKLNSLHLYVDGILVHSQKLLYISNLVGPVNSGPLGHPNSGSNGSPAAFVNAFIGTLPQFKYQGQAKWKQGPCHLIEESLNSNFISVIYALGPAYIGNFQSSTRLNELAKARLTQLSQSKAKFSKQLDHSSRLSKQYQSALISGSPTQIDHRMSRVSSTGGHRQNLRHSSSSSQANYYNLSEDRLLISIDARATSLMTLSRMRKIYTRFDCRQISRVLGISLQESSTPILLLHNTGLHLTGPSRGVGAVTIGHNFVRTYVPSPLHQTLLSVGGCYVLLAFVAQSRCKKSFELSLRTLVSALKQNQALQTQMDMIGGYQILSIFFRMKKHLICDLIIEMTFSLITDGEISNCGDLSPKNKMIQQLGAIRELICECFDLWVQTDKINLILEFIYDLINSAHNTCSSQINYSHTVVAEQSQSCSSPANCRAKNLKYLRELDLLPRVLRLLPQQDVSTQELSGDQTKTIFFIRQIVFELLNRTSRQSDLLYFGQFLASLLPHQVEKSAATISLRNILLKSLLQMMTRNKQKEVNQAMQEEMVRILGFDWFMLFINGSYLDTETKGIGFLNLMVVLSNDDLYANFKSESSSRCNGGWLKEPIFPTIDGKFNIQLLGINVGVFFGLDGSRKSIRQDVINASNLFLLTNCLKDLIETPNIYVMLFMLMTGKFNDFDSSLLETIGAFEKISFDSLCDCLVGDSHQKRRNASGSLQFKCYEMVICLLYMIRDIMSTNKFKISDLKNEVQRPDCVDYPTEIVKFIMYLYNNNKLFQSFCCRSEDLIEALSEALMMEDSKPLNDTPGNPDYHWTQRSISGSVTPSNTRVQKKMTQHPASKEVLELSRLIILDSMTDATNHSGPSSQTNVEHLQAFEKFLVVLDECREAKGILVDELMVQILLMVDSTTRNDSIQTISSSDNLAPFQLLLVNSIAVAQIVTDKIWSHELYNEQTEKLLKMIDHQLCLTEQIFKFNELLPKHSPPYAFIMQENLNRIILFALSRPTQHTSDKMLHLDLLKKIHDNRTLIVLNHMHCHSSAEFFVSLSYILMKLIEDNTIPLMSSQNGQDGQLASLIERQYGHKHRQRGNYGQDSPSSLMIASMSRKVWDSIYQSKRDLLSEALEVSLSLPAFTLETSPDLVQLKPDIQNSCDRFWSSFLDRERKPKPKRSYSRHSDQPTSAGTSASSAVNLLSGRLTKVVNAASFVSRVVGATAGSMASNVNLVGEKLSQTRAYRKEFSSSINQGFSSSESPNLSSMSPGGRLAQVTQATSPTSEQMPRQISANGDRNPFKSPTLTKTDIDQACRAHVMIMNDHLQVQLSQKNHNLALYKYVCSEWLDMETEMLLRERAIFGPTRGSKLNKWRLDMTEGPRRMRKKMMNNTEGFYENYPYRSDNYNLDNKSLRYRPPMSFDSREHYLKTLDMDTHFLEFSTFLTESNPSAGAIDRNTASRTESVAPTQLEDTEQAARDLPAPGAPTISIDRSKSSDQFQESCSIDNKDLTDQSIEEKETSISPNPTNQLSSRLSDQADIDDGNLDDDGDGDSTSFVDFSPEIEAESNFARESENMDSLSVLRLLEKEERISHMFRCSRVQGLDTHEGLMLFGREHFYLIDGFTLLKTREIKDIDSLPPDSHDPIIPNSTPNLMARSKKTCSKFSFDCVIEVHKRRYLLQPIALEVFSSDGRNILVVFPRNIRNKVFSRLMTVATRLNSNTHESLAGQKSNVSVEGGSGLLSNLIGETSVTQRWVRGELSNFQYLMNLNTIAGRSYNDLMQYPIFPWILADYTSDQLDLSNPSTFRDLARPVGAQTAERLEQFKKRYADWDDSETPPYHYGTFYSSAMIVASYMVRMEPFTQHFLRLQGGHFDLADRMFHSINDSWLSASKHNMADIKELIPEFFYLPEFLRNENRFDLGIKQNGVKLDDVILPPWAKEDAREFIRLHRSALESDYVSAHLHEWIDLIFGYKQQGQAAVDAVNVFHHLFYEGNVDIYNTDIDPIKKNAVIGFINNFGQVPKQLFKKPHPARKQISSSNSNLPSLTGTPSPILPSLSVAMNSQMLQKNLTHIPQALKPSPCSNLKDLKGPVGQIIQIDKSLVAVEQNKLLIPPEYCRYVAWGHADRSLRLGLYDSEKSISVWEGSDYMLPSDILCCTIPNNRTMITAGTDSLITVWKIERVKSFSPLMNLYGHLEPVTCLASSQSYSIVVSGSRDRTAIIWDLNKFTFSRQLGDGKTLHQGPISAIAINDSTGDIATCASSWLNLWTINGELLASVNSLAINLNRQVFGGHTIGAGMGQIQLLSVCFSQYHEWSLDEVIITGANDGSIAIWSMRYIQKVVDVEQAEDASTSIDRSKQTDETEDQSQDKQIMDPSPTDKKPENRSEVDHEIKSRAISERRKRTDTMNSDWVKLSNSSTSTIDTTDQVITYMASCPQIPRLDAEALCKLEDSLEVSTTFDKLSNIVDTSRDNSDIQKNSIAGPNGGPTESAKSLEKAAECLSNQSVISKINLFVNPLDSSIMKFSKSDTSLVDSFVILGDTSTASVESNHLDVTKSYQSESNPRFQPSIDSSRSDQTYQGNRNMKPKPSQLSSTNHLGRQALGSKLLPNHRWKRQLYLRALLSRRDGKGQWPLTPITSITISKDHRTVFVGDASGKVTMWSI